MIMTHMMNTMGKGQVLEEGRGNGENANTRCVVSSLLSLPPQSLLAHHVSLIAIKDVTTAGERGEASSSRQVYIHAYSFKI